MSCTLLSREQDVLRARDKKLEQQVDELKASLSSMDSELSNERMRRETLEHTLASEQARSASEERRECVVCFESEVDWMMLRPCGHVCVCVGCCERDRVVECPVCRTTVSDLFPAFF